MREEQESNREGERAREGEREGVFVLADRCERACERERGVPVFSRAVMDEVLFQV